MSLTTMTAFYNFYVSEYSRLVVEAAQHRRSGHHGNSYFASLCVLDQYLICVTSVFYSYFFAVRAIKELTFFFMSVTASDFLIFIFRFIYFCSSTVTQCFLYFLTVARLRCIRQQSMISQFLRSLYYQVSTRLLHFTLTEFSGTPRDTRYGDLLQALLSRIYRWFCLRHSLTS
jgi:hypothetical protein